ncbi:hypothetical protein, partial [Kaarinaea lacus]
MNTTKQTARTKTAVIATALLFGTLIAPAALMAAEATELAKEAWLFGLPLVMFEKQFDYGTYVTKPEGSRAPVNQFAHLRRFADASNRLV